MAIPRVATRGPRDLWRRYLAMVLDGIQCGDRHDEIPGKPPEQTELERIIAGWITAATGPELTTEL